MYAVDPSAEAITSCGSGPTGNLAVTFRLAGLTIRSVLSSLATISRALSGAVCASRPRALSKKTARTNSKVLIFIIVRLGVPFWPRIVPRTARPLPTVTSFLFVVRHFIDRLYRNSAHAASFQDVPPDLDVLPEMWHY